MVSVLAKVKEGMGLTTNLVEFMSNSYAEVAHHRYTQEVRGELLHVVFQHNFSSDKWKMA